MSADFTEFAEAVAAPAGSPNPVGSIELKRVCVLGGGTDARLLAALGLANGADVTLFSAYGSELSEISKGITIRGEGPIGTYQANPEGFNAIRTTAEIDSAVREADLLFLTGPIHKQRTYAMVLADRLKDGQIIVVPNARTFGALETARLLSVGGANADVTIAELQGLPFWIDQQGATLNLSMCTPRVASTLPAGRSYALDAISALIGPLLQQVNVVQSSLLDVASIVEYPVLCLGGAAVQSGGPHIVSGGVPLTENDTFRNMIGPQHERLIDTLMNERHRVASAFGVRAMPDIQTILDCVAGQPSGHGSRPVCSQVEAHKGLRDIAIGSLLPLISMADVAGISVQQTRGALATISTILGAEISSAGRSLSGLGISANDLDSTRRHLELAAKGAP